MSRSLEELPLFPLDTVLFPYASLQLHVFEERYREMVRDCMEFDRRFGIVLIREEGKSGSLANPYLVGTAVRIVQVHNYPDGRMDLHVQGERRFRIRQMDETGTYPVGLVEPVIEADSEDSARAHALVTRAREDFQLLIQRLLSHPVINVQVEFPPDAMALSFTIANLLPMENLEKQRLLESTDTLERLSELLPILQHQIKEVDSSKVRFRVASQQRAWKLRLSDVEEWVNPN